MNGINETFNHRAKWGHQTTDGSNTLRTEVAPLSSIALQPPQANSAIVASPREQSGSSSVLPSPTPSDDMGETHVGEKGHFATLSTALIDESRRYGSAAVSTTQTTNPTHASNAHRAEASDSLLTDSQEQLALLAAGGRKRSTDSGFVKWPKRPRAIFSPDSQNADLFPNAQTQSSPTSLSPPASTITSPVVEPTLPRLASDIRNFVQSKLNTATPLTLLDHQRCRLLEEACVSNDLFYVCLHKLCCSARLAEITGCSAPGLESNHFEGIRELEILIRSNSDLSLDALAFFAQFPSFLNETQSELHRRNFAKARTFLHKLSIYWEQHRKTCEIRGYPLFVDEMVTLFQLTSKLLQSIIFRSIHRHITKPEDPILNERVDRLFEQDQKAFSVRKPRPHLLPPQQLQAESQRLGQKYQNMVKSWTSERQKQVGHLTENTPNTFSADLNSNASFQASPVLANHHHPRPHPDSHFTNQIPNTPAFQGFSNMHPTLNSRSNSYSSPVNYSSNLNSSMASRSHSHSNHNVPLSVPSMGRRHMMHLGRQSSPSARNLTRSFLPGHPDNLTQAQSSSFANQVPQAPTMSFSVIDRQDLNTSVPPAPDNAHLQQLEQKISRFQKLDRTGRKDPNLKLYQYLRHFKTQVLHLGKTQASFTFPFNVSRDECERKVADVLASPGDSGRTRLYSHGKLLFRLKCIRYPPQARSFKEEQWVVMGQCWPKTCFVEINGHHPEIPRKDSHGKDLPLDITGYIIPGANVLEISLIRDTDEFVGGNRFYAVAIEAVAVSDEKGIREEIAHLRMEMSRELMTKALQSSQDDEDLAILDPNLSIDLVDPFSATIFKTPARGSHCLHRECFDLDNFLQTRKSSRTGAPCGADEWKCPICGGDSRPSQLLVDGFLQHVREKLEEIGKLDSKAVLIRADGSWQAKTESEAEKMQPETESTGQPIKSRATTSEKDEGQALVIDLEDD